MKKSIYFLPLLGLLLSGCGVSETFQALECNRQAIDMSTCAIEENIQAIEEANRVIAENRRQLEAINNTLKESS
jgi:uncharacterized protein YcfL